LSASLPPARKSSRHAAMRWASTPSSRFRTSSFSPAATAAPRPASCRPTTVASTGSALCRRRSPSRAPILALLYSVSNEPGCDGHPRCRRVMSSAIREPRQTGVTNHTAGRQIAAYVSRRRGRSVGGPGDHAPVGPSSDAATPGRQRRLRPRFGRRGGAALATGADSTGGRWAGGRWLNLPRDR
jgi:hypothetical protein